jgi:uncharacterized protein (TIGR03084 family)
MAGGCAGGPAVAAARRARDWHQLVADLDSTTDELVGDLTRLTEEEGDVASLCPGWVVRDVVVHLAVGDDLARRALLGEDCFPAPTADEGVLARESLERVAAYGPVSMAGAREAFVVARRELRAVVSALTEDERVSRVPWAARPISRVALVQSRLMETWVHGRDLRHPLGMPTAYDDRTWWIGDLGVRHVSYALAKEGIAPAPVVDLVLEGPGGGTWQRDGAAVTVTGPAWAWLLVVTRRAPGRPEALAALSSSAPAGTAVVETARAFA